jgi:hypothetical protein
VGQASFGPTTTGTPKALYTWLHTTDTHRLLGIRIGRGLTRKEGEREWTAGGVTIGGGLTSDGDSEAHQQVHTTHQE